MSLPCACQLELVLTGECEHGFLLQILTAPWVSFVLGRKQCPRLSGSVMSGTSGW